MADTEQRRGETGDEDGEGVLRYRLALLAAALLWSVGGLFIKVLSSHPAWHSSALGITFYRSLFAALCLLPLLRGRTLPKLKDTLISVVIYAALLCLYVAATQGTTAANAIFLQYTAPLYALVLGSVFFREPFRRADVAALAVAMVGIGILFFGSFRGGERGPLLMGLGSGAMFGLFLVWLRRLRYADPMAVTACNNGGVALLAGLGLAVGPLLGWSRPGELLLIPRALSGETVLLPVAALLVVMGCVQIAAPYVLFSYGLKRVSSVEASLLALVEPVLNPLWVALVVGERPTAATVAGGGLIVAALAARYTFFRPKSG
jgi:drug/metabolite transporter (DMT)-like permease